MKNFAITTLILIYLFVAFNSCSLSKEEPEPSNIRKMDIQFFKNQFSDRQYSKKLIQKSDNKIKIFWTPVWDKYLGEIVSDTAVYIYVPLEARTEIAPYTVNMIGVRKYLLIKQIDKEKIEFIISTYISSNEKNVSNLYNKKEFTPNFTGSLVLDYLDRDESSVFNYNNGVEIENNKIANKASKRFPNDIATTNDCIIFEICYWSAYCTDYTNRPGIVNGTVTSGEGVCEYPNQEACPTGNWGEPWNLTYSETKIDCNHEPAPPTPYDPGGGGDNTSQNPCPGDPIANPTIAPSSPANYRGGMYGYTRNAGTKFRERYRYCCRFGYQSGRSILRRSYKHQTFFFSWRIC